MQPDYSQYTINELLEVKNNISKDSPNYQRLLDIIESRKDEITEAQVALEKDELSIAKDRVIIVGMFQLGAALVIAAITTYSLISDGFSMQKMLLGTVFVLLNLVAGYTAFKELHRWYWLSIFNQALQILGVSIGGWAINYSGLGFIGITVDWTNTTSFGISMLFSPGVSIYEYSGMLSEQYIRIDGLAVLFIMALLTALESRDNESDEE